MTHRTVEIAQIMRKLRNRHVQTERDQELQAALHSLFEVGEGESSIVRLLQQRRSDVPFPYS